MPTPGPAPMPVVDVRTAIERGSALQRAGKPREALAWLLRAVALAPDSAAVWVAAGRALLDAGDPVQAEAAMRQAAGLAPLDAGVWVELGRVLVTRSVRDEPVACFRRAVDLAPAWVEARHRLGTSLVAVGSYDEGGAHLAEALRLDPNDPGALAGAASLLELRGDAAAAWALLKEYKGVDARVAAVAATCGRRTGNARSALRMVDVALRAASPVARSFLLYARGDLLDALDRPADAFDAWTQANASRGFRFDPAVHHHAITDLVTRTSGRTWPTGPVPGADRPVFVVGMPRTGSTLLEQALSRHPDVAAAGELETIRDIAVSIPRDGEAYWAHALDRLTEADRAALRDRYLVTLAGMNATASRVTDKMPSNLLHLGLVATILPGAAVLRCVRDPVDTAFSNFRQSFGAGMPWATRLEWIVAWQAEAERILDHWEATVPLRFLTVRYEELTAQPEAVLRRVLDHLGLPWDPAVLAPERSRRAVTTASALEVQEPIHVRSVGRAERYRAFLEPFFATTPTATVPG